MGGVNAERAHRGSGHRSTSTGHQLKWCEVHKVQEKVLHNLVARSCLLPPMPSQRLLCVALLGTGAPLCRAPLSAVRSGSGPGRRRCAHHLRLLPHGCVHQPGAVAHRQRHAGGGRDAGRRHHAPHAAGACAPAAWRRVRARSQPTRSQFANESVVDFMDLKRFDLGVRYKYVPQYSQCTATPLTETYFPLFDWLHGGRAWRCRCRRRRCSQRRLLQRRSRWARPCTTPWWWTGGSWTWLTAVCRRTR